MILSRTVVPGSVYGKAARVSFLAPPLGGMQVTLHATRRTPHGASRLVQAMVAWSMKTRRTPSRRCIGIRGSMVIRL